MRHSRRKELKAIDMESAIKSFWVGQTGLEDEVNDDFSNMPMAEWKANVEWINLGAPLKVYPEKWDHEIHGAECYGKQYSRLKNIEKRQVL